MSIYGPAAFVAALAIAMLAGVIKGVVGFAMPMIMVSGLASFLSPDLALAGLILPTLVTNGMQALRQGFSAAWASIKAFRVFLMAGFVMLILSAQLVRILPSEWLFVGMGGPVTIFAAIQLAGWKPSAVLRSGRIEAGVGGIAGFFGGLAGIWGPPTVAYLSAINVPKQEHLRIQGVVYGLGAVALFLAHIQSGVMRIETAPLSILLIAPAVLGIWLGFKIQDRIDQEMFRTVTLWVLVIAGLNLIRRGVF